MTEAEWLACGEPPGTPGGPPDGLLVDMPLCAAMIRAVEDTVTSRKEWLFRVACCRRVWGLMADERSRAAVEVAERLADDEATEDERDEAIAEATEAWDEADPITLEPEQYRAALASAAEAAYRTICPDEEWGPAIDAALAACDASLPDCESPAWRASWLSEQTFQCRLLRELFGNPFRPAIVDPAWRTSAALSLAQAAYEERELPSGHLDNARLGVLSDALEEAGCADADILSHLRSPGPHVRGCWAMDLILAKE
jgi:hypothetical protein